MNERESQDVSGRKRRKEKLEKLEMKRMEKYGKFHRNKDMIR